MNLIKPKKLQKGDMIGFLSASGNIRDKKLTYRAKEYFENKGFKVVISDTTFKKDRYFAGTDKERLDAIHGFFADKNINAIFCTRGGYGIIRLIRHLDYDLIKDNPKVFVGYSDYSAFHAMVHKKTGLVTFHGPVMTSDFGVEEIDKFTENDFFSTLESDSCERIYQAGKPHKTYFKGKAKGILWGGNLITLATLSGLDFIPDEKFIFFFEDVDEKAYQIDRGIRQLLNIGKFRENLAGMAIGQFTKTDKVNWIDDLFVEIANELKIPMANNFIISHGKQKYTLPYGVKCELNANTGSIEILEPWLS